MYSTDQINEVHQHAKQIYSKPQVEAAMDTMAEAITQRLKDSNPVFLTVMIGGIQLAAGLLSRCHFPLLVDYIHVTRYRGATVGGQLHWRVEPHTDFNDRSILIVDDILDGGVTLAEIIEYCYARGAKEVLTAVLVDKDAKRENNGVAKADFVGLHIEDRYLYGFGMDYHEYLRNAPGIYAVRKEDE